MKDRLTFSHTAARIIKCIILMADCNPERIMFYETRELIKLYSSFKYASDYR